MKLNVHIERLILDGLPIGAGQEQQIRSAIQQELASLLAAHGLSDELRSGIAVPVLRGGAIQLDRENQPAKLGHGIARAVHDGIRSSNEPGGARQPSPIPGGIPK